jgi:hypothetical protein
MNWETLERILEENIAVGPKDDDFTQNFHQKMRTAPRFVVGVPEKVTTCMECARDAMVDGRIALPFNTIKVIDTQLDLARGEHAYVIGVRRGNLVVFEAIRRNDLEFREQVLVASMSEEQLQIRGNPQTKGSDPLTISGGVMYKGMTAAGAHQDVQIAAACLGLIDRMCWLISLINTPGHYIAKVSPSLTRQRAHSVEWTEAKSHYIVLDRAHGKQLADHKPRDFNGSITRAMHDRRAHSRYMQSPRYKNSRFKRIWVRQAWVGPKEWEGVGGNQYKIINPEGKRFYEAE